MSLYQEFITLEHQASVKNVLDNALDGRETADFEFSLYTKDRKRVYVLLNATTRRNAAGRVVGMIGVGQDITSRKQVEIEKALVVQELRTFIDTANAPIFGIDAHGLVNEWNFKSASITGFSREEVMGKNLVQVSESLCCFPVARVVIPFFCAGVHHAGLPNECSRGFGQRIDWV